MSSIIESNVRCLKAIELTLRFLVTYFVPLACALAWGCWAFDDGYDTGVNLGLAVIVTYFAAAHNFYGRSKVFSPFIARLAGLSTKNRVRRLYIHADQDDSVEDSYLPSDQTVMAGIIGMGIYAAGTTPEGAEADDCNSMFGDSGYGFNPATSLPMMDSLVDIHGNIFGTSSADDIRHGSPSTFDDSSTCNPFGDGFSASGFDDDWCR